MEGHPDNVAACLGGGLTIAWTEDRPPRMVRLEPLSSIRPVICVAPAAGAHRGGQAPAARPGAAPGRGGQRRAQRPAGRRADPTARADAGAGARLTDAGALLDATRDWLHQDYRAAAMPETAALVSGCGRRGIPAVVSGAGPSVLALLLRAAKSLIIVTTWTAWVQS